MLFCFVYLVFVSLLKLVVRSGRPAQVKDIEHGWLPIRWRGRADGRPGVALVLLL